MNVNSKEFRKLKDEWYQKLKDTGFKDEERLDGNMKQWESTAFVYRYNKHNFAPHQKYFELAGQYLHDGEFLTKKQEEIWKLHAEGATIRAISVRLKKEGFRNVHPATVHAIVKKIKDKMLALYDKEDE